MSMLRRIAIICRILESKTEGVRHLLDAIAKWKDLAHQELADWQKRLEEEEDAHEYDWDNIGDEAYMIKKTEALMYANVAVSLFAVAEDFLRVLCLNLNGTEVHKQIKANDKPDWGQIRNALKQKCGIEYNKIKHFDTMDRVRLLNNCFKHNSGRPNKKYIKKYGGDYIKEIEYEKEDWGTIISECKTFLLNLANQVKDAVKRELNI